MAINSYSNLLSYHAYHIRKDQKLLASHSNDPRTLLQALMCLRTSTLRSYRYTIFIYLLQLVCHPVAVVILHVYKT